MECYSSEHISWSLLIGAPILFFWVISLPIFAFILLCKNIHKENDNKVKQYFLIMYQGFKPKTYYWEFVNTLRKVLILMTLTLFISYNPLYKVLSSVIILVITTRIQIRLKPYKDDRHNYIELLGIYSGALTLFTGVIFSDDGADVGWMNLALFILIVIVNTKFATEWFYLFVLCMGERFKWLLKLKYILEVLLCKREHEKEIQPKKIKKVKSIKKRIRFSSKHNKKPTKKKAAQNNENNDDDFRAVFLVNLKKKSHKQRKDKKDKDKFIKLPILDHINDFVIVEQNDESNQDSKQGIEESKHNSNNNSNAWDESDLSPAEKQRYAGNSNNDLSDVHSSDPYNLKNLLSKDSDMIYHKNSDYNKIAKFLENRNKVQAQQHKKKKTSNKNI